MLLAAAADGAVALVELLQTLVLMLLLMRLEMMRLLGMEGEVMPVAEQRQLDHGGPVKARPALEAFALEAFGGGDGGARTALLSAHLRRARPLVGGLHLSLHPPCWQVSRMVPGRYCGSAGATGNR